MRKEIVGHGTHPGRSPGKPDWLDLEPIARVELASEDPAFPIEDALRQSGAQRDRVAPPLPGRRRQLRSSLPCRRTSGRSLRT
jgi:hypothetical protein